MVTPDRVRDEPPALFLRSVGWTRAGGGGTILAMPSKQDILKRRDEIIAVASRYGASELRIFGSVARGDSTEASDVDFVVRFEPGRSLFDQGGLLMDLRQLLGVNVDVISEGALTGRFGQIVREEAVPL